jgi:hypothetical protein
MRKSSNTRYVVTVVVAGLVAALTAGVVRGAPVNAPKTADLTLTCPSGTISAVINLVRGEWIPAHATDSNTVFIPLAFGEFTGAGIDADGNVLFTVDLPPLVKGSAVPENRDLVECTGVIEFEFPGGHFSGVSTATGFFANP